MNIDQQPPLFDAEPLRERTERSADEVAEQVAAIAAAAIRNGQTSTSEGARNAGTQRMIDDLGGGEPRETTAVDPPHFALPERKRRPTGSVRDLESDRDHQLDAERAEFEELTDEQLAERREISARGRTAAEAALDDAFGKDRKIEAIRRKVEQMIPIDPDDVAGSEAARERQLTAMLRTYFDNKPS